MRALTDLRRLGTGVIILANVVWTALILALPRLVAGADLVRRRAEHGESSGGLAAVAAGYSSPLVPAALLVPALVVTLIWWFARR